MIKVIKWHPARKNQKQPTRKQQKKVKQKINTQVNWIGGLGLEGQLGGELKQLSCDIAYMSKLKHKQIHNGRQSIGKE